MPDFTGPGVPTSDNYTPTLERAGVVGVDIVGSAGNVAGQIPGVLGDVIGGTLTGVANAIQTPWRMAVKPIAETRLKNAYVNGDSSVDKKYLNMVAHGESISDVADLMAAQGVAVTGGVAHDLLLNVFLDPFNVIAAGIGKGISVGAKASSIQSRYGNAAHQSMVDGITRHTAVSPVEMEWLNSNKFKKFAGHVYGRTSRGLSGIKAATAHAMLGRAAPFWFATIGIKGLTSLFNNAGDAAAVLEDAAGAAAHHMTMDAGASLITRRVYGEVRASAIIRAKIISESKGVNDATKFEEFVRATSSEASTGDLALQEIRAQWEYLHQTYENLGNNRKALTDAISVEDTAGIINTNVGKSGVGPLIADARTVDDAFLRRMLNVQRDHYVSENTFVVAAGTTDAERIAIARYEYVSNTEGIIGRAAAEKAFAEHFAAYGKYKNTETLVRNLGEIMYTSQMVRFGDVANKFGEAKMSLLSRIEADPSILGKLPAKTRAIISEQLPRLSVVARDTLTDIDASTLLKQLTNESLTIEQRAQFALNSAQQFTSLRKRYHIPTLIEMANNDPEKLVKIIGGTIEDLASNGSLLKQVPITAWKGVSEAFPELKSMTAAAERGGYKLALEPESAASITSKTYVDQGGKDFFHVGVDTWVPITGNKMAIDFGNRNALGRAFDTLFNERTTASLMANTLARMSEYSIANNLPLSQSDIKLLHRTLMQKAMGEATYSKSIRNIVQEQIKTFDMSSNGNILDQVVSDIKLIDRDAGDRLAAAVKDGTLRNMIFYAAEGDWQKIGIPTKITGWMKTKGGIVGDNMALIGDSLYPSLKFKVSQIFSMQDIYESKFWNTIRGYQDEWKLGIPGLKDIVRFGNKRKYTIIDPATGEKVTLDATQIIAEAMMVGREELKYAQQMGIMNQHYGAIAADAVMNFGENNTGFMAALRGALKNDYGKIKDLDYMKFVGAEGLDQIVADLTTRIKAVHPDAWEKWMISSGGDERGAVLLFLRERKAIINGRASARAYFESQKPYGVGFGRAFDDDVLKLIDKAANTAKKKIGLAWDVEQTGKVFSDLRSALSVLHADANAIGYSQDSINALKAATEALNQAENDIRLVANTGELTAGSKKIIAEAFDVVNKAKAQMRLEFETAVRRRKFVEDLVAGLDGVTPQIKNEVGQLFIMAERRKEMLPELSTAITRALRGEEMSPNLAQKVADHLIKIRGGHVEEETLWNALGHSLDGAMKRAEHTHYFSGNRGLIERSLNHPVLALYPSSYMFGKVLPEYARALYLSPTSGLTGALLAPYTAILRLVTGGKFSAESWGKYAPLIGFNAVRKVRDAMLRDGQTDQGKPSALTYLIANTLIPGLPTEISVSLNPTIKRMLERSASPSATLGDIASTGLKAGVDTLANISGPARTAQAFSDVVSQGFSTIEEAGGPIEAAGQGIRNAIQGLDDILHNR